MPPMATLMIEGGSYAGTDFAGGIFLRGFQCVPASAWSDLGARMSETLNLGPEWLLPNARFRLKRQAVID